jgi:DNA-binding MarR family transcriptional regulator
MEREKESREIMDRFMRLVHKYNAMEKTPARHGKDFDLFHSERHILDKVGENPGINVTEFAQVAGVTKGAISQVIKKLEQKGLVRRYKKSGNDKEVFIELTEIGKDICQDRKRINQETIQEISEELRRYSDDEVAFLLGMFRWFEQFLDRSRKAMMHGKP